MILHYGDLIDGNCLVHIINTTKPTEIYNLGAQSHVKVTKIIIPFMVWMLDSSFQNGSKNPGIFRPGRIHSRGGRGGNSATPWCHQVVVSRYFFQRSYFAFNVWFFFDILTFLSHDLCHFQDLWSIRLCKILPGLYLWAVRESSGSSSKRNDPILPKKSVRRCQVVRLLVRKKKE